MLKVKEASDFGLRTIARELEVVCFQVEVREIEVNKYIYSLNGILFPTNNNVYYPLITVAGCIRDLSTAFKLKRDLNELRDKYLDSQEILHLEVKRINGCEFTIITNIEDSIIVVS